MTTFRVWAPNASRADVDTGGACHPMALADRGWWHTQVPSVGPGSDYAFRLDGGGRLPDPRSPWQPYGPGGPSRVVDHASFPWTDAKWQAVPLASAVIYELHIGTFTRAGTFDAAIERLDHLAHLGITHVELMPVAEFQGRRGWGYDGVYLFAPHHAYGGPDGLKRFVNACHGQGLAVLLDVVYSHLGCAGNCLDRFGPYSSARHSTPWGPALNLDGRDSDEVRTFVTDNAEMWLRDYHLDGLRLDAAHAILDTSAMHLLEELASAARAMEAELGRRVVLVAESGSNDPRLLRSPASGGYGIDALWNDDFHHALHALLTGESSGYYIDFGLFSDLAKALTSGFVLDGQYSAYRGRRHGRPATGLTGGRFVAFLQNHDQVGNRARGERASHQLSADRLKVAAALVLTSPFVPLLFQGEEWAASTPFPYFLECDDAAASRAVLGREKELASLGWDGRAMLDPRAPETHAQAVLDWGELDREPHAEVLDWHRELVRLRRRFPALSDGRMDQVKVRFDEQGRWFVLEHGPITVACNLSEVPRLVPLIGQDVLLASKPRTEVAQEGVLLPPDSVAILASPDVR